MNWDEAACKGKDPAIFYPQTYLDDKPAKAICSGCTQQEPCLALGMHETEGIWGGMTPSERRREAVRRRHIATIPA